MAEATEDILEWQVKQLNKVLYLWLPGRLQGRRQPLKNVVMKSEVFAL